MQNLIIVLFTVNVVGCIFNLITAEGVAKLGWFSALLGWGLLLFNKMVA